MTRVLKSESLTTPAHMTDNPYSPPAISKSDSPSRSWVCVCMFWLSAILGIGALAISVVVGYQNTRFISQNGGSLPPYIIAVTMLIFACGIGLLFSAWNWRSRRIRAGLLSFFASGIAFFAGPWLLLLLLAR